MRLRNRPAFFSGSLKWAPLLFCLVAVEYYFGNIITDQSFRLSRQVSHIKNSVSDYFRDFRSIEKENSLLRDTNIGLAKNLAEFKYFRSRYDTLFEENRHLKKLLALKTTDSRPVFTRPIRVFNQAHNHSVRAERPEEFVQSGMIVLNEDGIVVGRVASISPSSILIYFLNDKRSALPVVVSEKNINAVAIGNGRDIDLVHIPMDSGIKPGDFVRTLQTKNGGVDYQMIGHVDYVQDSPDKSFLIAKVSQVEDLRSLQWLILLPN